MKFKKPNFWNSINFFSIILLPFSLITLVINILKSLVIEEQRFNIPIICVGNIFVGGTGKTPLSIYIYNFLKKKGFKPAIVRKYYRTHVDEINLTKDKVKKFYFGKKRFLSILKAEQKNNNVIIMDDGFQDCSIKKDLNILCFNSLDKIGNGFLLPAGPLRDQLNKVNTCQIAIINGKKNISFEKELKLISNNIRIYQSKYIIKNIKKFKGKKIFAFAGIGNPDSFFNLLKESGLNIKDRVSFPDHYNYTKNEILDLILRAKKEKLKLITTEKDFYRIKKFGLKKVDYVSIELRIKNYNSFIKEVLKNV